MKKIKVYLLNIAAVKGREEYLCSLLPKERVLKAQRFVVSRAAALSLGAGYLVYRYIGGYFTDEFGKPRSEDRFFNLSHSGDYAALAVCEESEIGVDIEESEDKDEKLVNYCLCDEEKAEYAAGTEFVSLFVAKESLSKAEGRGLISDIKSIPALPLNGRVEYAGKTYYRHAFTFDGYRGSVTVEGEDFIVETEEIKVI